MLLSSYVVGNSTFLTSPGGIRVKQSAARRNRVGCRLLAALLWLAAVEAVRADGALQFEGAWIRALPPGMGMTAGFGNFRNTGSEVIELKNFSSPQFAEVSLHRTETVEGMSRMVGVPSLRVEPAASVELAPGGYHLMLMRPTVAVGEGTLVKLRVVAADGREFQFEMPVVRR